MSSFKEEVDKTRQMLENVDRRLTGTDYGMKVFIEIFGIQFIQVVKRKHEDARRLKGKENLEERADEY